MTDPKLPEPLPAAGSTPEPARQSPALRLARFYETLTPAALDGLGQLYAPDARFKDPFNEVVGIAAIRRIFAHMFATTEAPRFEVTDCIEQGGQAMQADMVAGGEGQAAADFTRQVGQRAAGIVQYVEDLVSTRQQGAAGLGQANLAAEAVEQAHAQLLFQAGDALAYGRLGQVQALAGFGKAAGFGDGDKGIEVGQIHGALRGCKDALSIHSSSESFE